MRNKCPRANLPPFYALELLTVYAWEAGTQEDANFRLDEGLATVMELLQDHELICIYWTKYYTLQNPVIEDCVRRQLKRERYWATVGHQVSQKNQKGRLGVGNMESSLDFTKYVLRLPTGQHGLLFVLLLIISVR